MFHRYFFQPRRYKVSLKSANSTASEVLDGIKNFETPEKFKGTFVERWGKYWKNLYIDYKDVAVDVAKDCKERPIRASIYASLVACCIYLGRHNPDERSFREELIRNTMKVMQLGQPIRNPISEYHVKWIEQCYNEGIIRRLSLGIVSLIWLDNYEEGCALYKTICPYLKPRYVTFYQRVVDVGFLDKWWLLENKMIDYDVNEAEFNNVQM